MPIAILGTLIASIGKGLADEFISGDGAKQWINFGFDLLGEGSEAEIKLRQAQAELEAKIEEAKATGTVYTPDESELEAVWSRIRARDDAWDQI